MDALDIVATLEGIMRTLPPSTLVIVRLPEGEVESPEEEASDVYDIFSEALQPAGVRGGGVQDAILMDNPMQS